MTTLTQDQIAVKIATAENGLAQATTQYDRNLFVRILEEYKRYAVERAKAEPKSAAAAGSAA
jgi:hypothetical protein